MARTMPTTLGVGTVSEHSCRFAASLFVGEATGSRDGPSKGAVMAEYLVLIYEDEHAI